MARRPGFRFQLKQVDDAGVFSGIASVFGHLDAGGDIVMPGAFAESLARQTAEGKAPAMLWQHDQTQPIGVWTKLTETPDGLYVEGRLVLEVARAREAHALMKAGALNGLSIGYATILEEWDHDQGARILKELDLWEVSIVTFPMCEPARVAAVKKTGRSDPASAKRDAFAPLARELKLRGAALRRLSHLL